MSKSREGKSKTIPLFLLQKQAIRRAAIEYFGVATFFLLIDIALLVVYIGGGAQRSLPFLPEALIFAFVVLNYICFVRRLKILRRFKCVDPSAEQAATIRCKKASVLFEAIAKSHWVVGCIVFVDECGERFYYIYPRDEAPKDADKKQIIKRYAGRDIEVVCYGESNIIKALSE